MVASIYTRRTPVDSSPAPIASVRPPVEVGVALDGKGRQVVQLFYNANIPGFLLLLLGCGKFDIGSAPQLEAERVTNCTKKETRNTWKTDSEKKPGKDKYIQEGTENIWEQQVVLPSEM